MARVAVAVVAVDVATAWAGVAAPPAATGYCVLEEPSVA